MNLVERWARHDDLMSEAASTGKDTDATFALRGDKALVIFDEDGYFLVVDAGRGTPPGTNEEVAHLLMLEDAKGNREPFYCEPIWISGYYDHFDYLAEEAAR